MNFASKLSYTAMCLGSAVLAASGIGVFVLGSPPMTHWVLLAHVAAAPVFAVALAVTALTWGEQCSNGSSPHLGVAAKALFWVMLVCGLVVILSGVMPMTPLFGTDGQRVLYLTHRYAGMAFAVAVLLHLLTLRCCGSRAKGQKASK